MRTDTPYFKMAANLGANVLIISFSHHWLSLLENSFSNLYFANADEANRANLADLE